ncbi:DUF4395 domain-containing protein [Paenibacillus ginsengarvi]|uniref:DUF4395 domain-containing protein n=1 Tax=Paenibacillus ginsengarvi TaxID=400777 RepID=A0A3B0C174_9BACL|nr:DUF4395 domain-containing protein [Paenibacillus ginsengarvi]RKN78224.1 DUF4395 domain-containing protein [Paenibacillus ginsengarvi]
MSVRPESVPRPLVRANQWVIVIAVVLTWITGKYWLLSVPLLAGAMGVIFDFNPIMRFAKLFLRKPMSGYIPEDKAGQQFNQVIAVTFLLLALLGYSFALPVMGVMFSALVALAAFVAICGFCIGCFIRYRYQLWLKSHFKS